MAVNLSGYSKEWLVSDQPIARLLHESREILTAREPAQDTVARLSSLQKEWLISDQPQARLYAEAIEYLTATALPSEPSNLYRMFTEVLYRMQDMSFYQESKETLIVLNSVPTIHNIVGMVAQRVWSKAVWPTLANTISVETTYQVAMKVLQRSPLAQPQSLTRVMSVVEKVLARDAMGMPIGPNIVTEAAQLVLQSDLREHIPVSMDYVSSMATIVLRAHPLAIYQSDTRVYQSAMKVLRKTPMGFLPRSITTVRQSAFKVLHGTDRAFLPHSITTAYQSVQEVLHAYISPLPDQGSNEVKEVAACVLQSSEFLAPASTTSVCEISETVLQKWTGPAAQSFSRVPAVNELVLQKSAYPLPGNMTGVFAMQAREVVLAGAEFTVPDLIMSRTRAYNVRELVLQSVTYAIPAVSAQVPQTGLLWHIQTTYPRPGDIIPPTKSALVPSIAHMTWQHVNVAPLQSLSRVQQLAQETLQFSEYDTPENMFNKGIFVWQAVEQKSVEDIFPDPSDMHSPVRADMVIGLLAVEDNSFPDPTADAQPAEASQVIEQVALSSEFPDPTGALSSAEADLISQQVAVPSDFADPTKPLSNGEASQLLEQVAGASDFPDPASLKSPASVTQMVGQIAQATAYPDPVKPASRSEITFIAEMVARPDDSLNGVQSYEIKHRPIITVNIVYSAPV